MQHNEVRLEQNLKCLENLVHSWECSEIVSLESCVSALSLKQSVQNYFVNLKKEGLLRFVKLFQPREQLGLTWQFSDVASAYIMESETSLGRSFGISAISSWFIPSSKCVSVIDGEMLCKEVFSLQIIVIIYVSSPLT